LYFVFFYNYFCFVLALVAKFLREPPGGAKRAKHRAKRSPEGGDPAKQGHAQLLVIELLLVNYFIEISLESIIHYQLSII
jgi:hypothetical protein